MSRELVAAAGLLTFLLLAPVGSGAAEESKRGARVAVVDIQRVIELSLRGQQARERFKREILKKQREMESYEMELSEIERRYQEELPGLAGEAREKFLAKTQERVRDLRHSGEDVREELQRMEQGLTDQMVEELQRVTRALAERQGIELVLEKGRVGESVVLPQADLTPLVIEVYDAQVKQKEAGPTP